MTIPNKKHIIRPVWTGTLNGANSLILIIALLTAYTARFINPDTSVIPSFAAMVFPIIALVVPLMLIFDLIVRPRSAWYMVAAIILCAHPFFNFFPVNIEGQRRVERADSTRTFTLMTYNVHNFDDLTRESSETSPAANPAITAILHYSPDIVALQECFSLKRSNRRSTLHEQLDSLRRMYPHSIVGPGNLTLLSKYPARRIDVDSLHRKGTFEGALYELEMDGGNTLHLLNVHLQSIGLDDDDKELYRELTSGGISRSELRDARFSLGTKLAAAFRRRGRQARMLRNIIDTIPGNIVVCGDFNDVPGSYAVATIEGRDLNDAYLYGAFGPTHTYNANRFLFRIDHILYRGSLEVLYTFRDDNRGSDHYPLIATFKWTKFKQNN